MSEKAREDVIDLSAIRKKPHGKRRGRPTMPSPGTPGADFQFMRKQAARRARVRRNRLILVGAFVLLIVGVFGVRIALTLGSGIDSFYPGISVDGLNLQGATREEAIEKLTQYNQERLATMSVKLSYQDREWSIAAGLIGAQLNIEEVVDEAWKIGREGNIFERSAAINALKRQPYTGLTTMTYDAALLEKELRTVKSQVDVPAQDAQIDFDPSREERFRILPETAGREVPLDGLLRTAREHLDRGLSVNIPIEPMPVEPQVTAADLQESTTRIRRVTTPLGESKEARIHNIKLALSKFNGMVIQPGQEVSFNQVTGPRDLANGYQNAGVILDDEITDGPGGGVCQVSTTLYQALVRSGVQIIKSQKHSLAVSYVPVGTDAAVAYDYLDLVFKNNTESPIFLICEVVGSNVSVMVHGRPLEEGVEIRIVNDVYETIPAPEPEIRTDTAGEFAKYTDEKVERKKSREGYRVRTYAVWYKDGEETRRENLRDDYYKEVKGISYVGVSQRPVEAGGGGEADPGIPVIGI